jgi:hypothetical protein
MAEANLDLLIGRVVLSRDGERVGRIEAIKAERQGQDLIVTEFHVGAYAALERLSSLRIGIAILGLIGLARKGYHIPWDKLDISDPRQPMSACSSQDLRDHYMQA